MDYHSLEYFIRVCETRNISNAARSLFISQQALSKTITHLEEEFQARFFIRSRSGVELTEAGHQFLIYAISTLSHRARIQHTINALNSSAKDYVSFGFSTGMMVHFPPQFLSDFILNHPEAEISLHSYQDDPYHRTIIAGDSRIVLGSTHPGNSRFQILHEAHTDLGIMMHRSHPLAGRQYLTWDDMMLYPHILLNIENDYSRRLLENLELHGITPKYVVNPAESLITDSLLLSQQALTVYGGNRKTLPPWAVVLPLEGLDLKMDFYLCAETGAELNKTELELIEVLKNELSSF